MSEVQYFSSRYSVDKGPEPMNRNDVYSNQMIDYCNSERVLSVSQAQLPTKPTGISPKKRMKASKFRSNSHLEILSKKRNSH